jgi:putative SOS response-associated peptidase YedK
MCNEAYRRIQIQKLCRDFGETRIRLDFPEGVSNFPPLESIRITDRLEIIRACAMATDAAAASPALVAEMVTRRWSWPMASGRPVYNFRSDGRAIAAASRCLIPVDGFFEFTDPPPPAPGEPMPRRKPLKSKWAFTLAGHDWFCIAGIWRADPVVGEAWAMLTCPPGPDIAPYHDRQVVVIRPPDYARWLDGSAPASDLCRPLPAGSFGVERVR